MVLIEGLRQEFPAPLSLEVPPQFVESWVLFLVIPQQWYPAQAGWVELTALRLVLLRSSDELELVP